MKTICYFLFVVVTAIGCSIDNYDKPSLTVSGKILDSETGAMVESGGANGGTIVRFFENGSTQPLLYRTYPDGSFVNKAMFAGNYTYTAEGPFRPVDPSPKAVIINDNASIEIPVVPYLRLKTSVVSVSGTTAEIKVEYSKTKPEDVFTNLGLVYSTYPQPNVFTTAGGAAKIENVSAQNLTSGEVIISVTGLTAGKKYYFRAAGSVVNPGNYYNYGSQAEAEIK